MSVRKFRPEDTETVVALANKAWKPINKVSRARLGDKIADILRPAGDDVSKGITVRQQLAEHPENFFVCEEEGRIVGFAGCSLDFNSKIGTVGHNAADKSCGVKGIGQQLYKAVLNYFREQGMVVAKVFTGLDEAHAPARRAYQRAGFNRSLEHVTYYMEL